MDLVFEDIVMSDVKKEKLLEALYETCLDRTTTSEQVFHRIVKKLELIGTEHLKDRSIEVIRPYKQTGKNLEETLNKLYDVLYNSSITNSGSQW